MTTTAVPYENPNWHPDMRPDVVVRIRSATHGPGAAAVLTAEPPTGATVEGRRFDIPNIAVAHLIIGLLATWVEALKEPTCVVLDCDDELAAHIAAGRERGPDRFRRQRLRLWADVTWGHHLRLLGEPRPIVTDYVTAHIEEGGVLLVNNDQKGEA